MKSYKSLVAWQYASKLCEATLETVDDHWHARAAALFEQLRRAVISADVNIVEGYALNTIPLFRHHLRISIGSTADWCGVLTCESGRSKGLRVLRTAHRAPPEHVSSHVPPTNP